MQQKSKYIILITLICFIFGFSMIGNALAGIIVTGPDCPPGEKEECHIEEYCYNIVDEVAGTYFEVCGDAEVCDCEGNGGGNGDDEKKGWACQPTGSCGAGTCTSKCVYKKGGSYNTQEKCEKYCCMCCICRKSYNPFSKYPKVCRCEGCNKGCTGCKADADCNNGVTTPTITKYSCNTSTWTCDEDSNGVYSSLSVCKDNCVEPSGPLSCPGNDYCYTCNKTTYQCYKSSSGPYTTLNMCRSHCRAPSTGPTSPPPTSPPPVSPPSNGGYTPPVWTPPAGPPPPPPETQPCMINYFELPERAWVGYPITGKWSASDWCDDCDVDCTPYPECVWKQDSIGTGFDEYKFTLEQSGTYNYTLTCYGEGGIDERTESATVEALNLPWWREIIPVLPGFLRGIWR